jgi:anti-sigma regulatory factor (Ser/Thr protein kinase)
MPSEIHAISPTVDRLMRLMEGSQCVQGAARNVEVALREALRNAVVYGNQTDPKTKVHIRCRCGPGNEISIVVTRPGKGFDFGKTIGNGLTSEPAGEHGCGIEVMRVAIDEVSFEQGRTEVHKRRQRTRLCFVEAGVRVR